MAFDNRFMMLIKQTYMGRTWLDDDQKGLPFLQQQILSDMTVTVVNVMMKLFRGLLRGTEGFHNCLIRAQELLNT